MTRTSNQHRLLAGLAGVAAVGALLLLPATAGNSHDGSHHIYDVSDISYSSGPPTLPAGAQFAVLVGNPAEEGPFVMRLKFPAGYQIPPHRHPKEEHVTVISGGFGMALGERLDRTAASILGPGSFIQIPTGEAHFAWTDEETVVQINAMGPFGIEYVNPADDPRTH
jgi:quercetin dioxygenase-like cupin family protein